MSTTDPIATVRVPQSGSATEREGVWEYAADNPDGGCLGAFLGYADPGPLPPVGSGRRRTLLVSIDTATGDYAVCTPNDETVLSTGTLIDGPALAVDVCGALGVEL